jgi:hypothetical protein
MVPWVGATSPAWRNHRCRSTPMFEKARDWRMVRREPCSRIKNIRTLANALSAEEMPRLMAVSTGVEQIQCYFCCVSWSAAGGRKQSPVAGSDFSTAGGTSPMRRPIAPKRCQSVSLTRRIEACRNIDYVFPFEATGPHRAQGPPPRRSALCVEAHPQRRRPPDVTVHDLEERARLGWLVMMSISR